MFKQAKNKDNLWAKNRLTSIKCGFALYLGFKHRLWSEFQLETLCQAYYSGLKPFAKHKAATSLCIKAWSPLPSIKHRLPIPAWNPLSSIKQWLRSVFRLEAFCQSQNSSYGPNSGLKSFVNHKTAATVRIPAWNPLSITKQQLRSEFRLEILCQSQNSSYGPNSGLKSLCQA